MSSLIKRQTKQSTALRAKRQGKPFLPPRDKAWAARGPDAVAPSFAVRAKAAGRRGPMAKEGPVPLDEVVVGAGRAGRNASQRTAGQFAEECRVPNVSWMRQRNKV